MKSPPPTHIVRFILSATHQLIPREKEAPVAVSTIPKTKAKAQVGANTVPVTNAADDRRSFQLQYSIQGAQVMDAKSSIFSQPEVPKTDKAPIPPAPMTWQTTHEIDITKDLAVSLLTQQQQIEIGVYEIVKVEVEKKSGITRELLEDYGLSDMLDASLADSGLTAKQQKQRLKAIQALLANSHASKTDAIHNQSNSISSKDLISASRPLSRATTASGATTGEENGLDLNTTHHYHETPHPHHYDHPEKHMRRASEGSMLRTRSAQSLINLSLLRPKTPPSPHHCESPLATLQHARPGSNGPVHMPPPPDLSGMRPKLIKRPGSAGAALKSARASVVHEAYGMKTVFEKHQPKSLPHLNHIEPNDAASVSNSNTNTTTTGGNTTTTTGGTTTNTSSNNSKKKKGKVTPPQKKRYVLETRRILVGRMKIDLTNLFCGSLAVNGTLESPVDGMISLKSIPHLLHLLNPISISLLTIENMPRTPVSYIDLDTHCLPTTANFQFFNDKHVHEVCVNSKHARVAAFGTRHVVFAGLLDARELQERVGSEELVVKIYDRIPKRKKKENLGTKDDGKSLEVDDDGLAFDLGPYGVASFNLKEFLSAGPAITRLRAPVLPSSARTRRSHGYKNSSSFPAAHWMEYGTNLVIECQTFGDLVNPDTTLSGMDVAAEDDEKVFGRVVVFSRVNNDLLRDTIDSIITSENLALTSLQSTNEEESLSKTDDYISGLIFTDPIDRIHILEGLRAGAISKLKNALTQLQNNQEYDCKTVFQFDPDASFTERIWDLGNDRQDARVVRCEFGTPLEAYISAPRIYVKDVIPERAFKSLMWLNKLKSMQFLIENTSKKRAYYPSRKSLLSLADTFGIMTRPLNPLLALLNHERQVTVPVTPVTLPTVPAEPTFKNISIPGISKRAPMISNEGKKKKLEHSKIQVLSVAQPRERAPYNADGIFNYSMQKESSTRLALEKIRKKMRKDVCYSYSRQFQLEIGKVDI
ncbi:hypothetical protein HDU98_012038 [Podochytrium sp. JEL0797]|nr:hypothetical protein HDU98_012038 [Podochytrium sp. JEL0797]